MKNTITMAIIFQSVLPNIPEGSSGQEEGGAIDFRTMTATRNGLIVLFGETHKLYARNVHINVIQINGSIDTHNGFLGIGCQRRYCKREAGSVGGLVFIGAPGMNTDGTTDIEIGGGIDETY